MSEIYSVHQPQSIAMQLIKEMMSEPSLSLYQRAAEIIIVGNTRIIAAYSSSYGLRQY